MVDNFFHIFILGRAACFHAAFSIPFMNQEDRGYGRNGTIKFIFSISQEK